jgi:hypothetical protein
VPVVVVVPKKVGTPHEEPSGAVVPENHVADRTTSPAYVGTLGANQVALWTIYAQWLNVIVNDQFGKRLDALYAGVGVDERAGATWRPINQAMTADGTYRDPVFSYTPKTPGPAIVTRGSAAADSWPTDPKGSITEFSETQDIAVRVGGHELSTGIVNRKVTAEAPDKITIEWPE